MFYCTIVPHSGSVGKDVALGGGLAALLLLQHSRGERSVSIAYVKRSTQSNVFPDVCI